MLRPINSASSAPCPDCGDLHRVQIEVERATGKKRGYISCPQCGVNEIDLAALRRWIIDIGQLLLAVFGDAQRMFQFLS